MSARSEESGLAAVVARAQTRCACGRFGIRESGFCSAECAATALTASAIAAPSAANPHAMPTTTDSDASEVEIQAYLMRLKSYPVTR